MKMSNFLLSVVACLALGLAVGSSSMVMSRAGTSVISVPAEIGGTGGGLAIKLPSNLTSQQAMLLALAYDIAKKDGHRYPQLLQGILLQETRAGEMDSYKVAGQEFGLKTNERYYGIMQIKLSAAKDVLTRYPALRNDFGFHTRTDEEIIAKLIENQEFNLSVASKYLLVLKTSGYDTVKQLALAYNQGAGGARAKNPETNHYSLGVMANIQKLSGG